MTLRRIVYKTIYFLYLKRIERLHETRHISVSCAGSFDIPSDVHSCIFHDITSGQAGEMIGSLPLELNHLQRSVMEHQRAPKRYLLFQFCQKIDRIGKLRICFISKITKHKAFCDWTTGTTSNV